MQYYQFLYGLPRWMTRRMVLFFFVAFLLCTLIFGYPMEIRFATISSLSVVLFFFGTYLMLRQWINLSEKMFLHNVFVIGLIIRLIWVAYCFFYFNEEYYGLVQGDNSDPWWYMAFGEDITQWIKGGFPCAINELLRRNNSAVDDFGYPLWLAIEYLFVGTWGDIGKVLIPMVIKTIISTQSAIYIYRVAQRHYGDCVARMACLFVVLNPNMIYWCGTMYKEPEMVFLCCLFVDETDKVLGQNIKMTFRGILPATLVGMSLFLFRSALGLVAFAAVMAHVVLASNRIMSFGKKVLAGVIVAFVLLVGMGEGLRTRVYSTIDTVQSDEQQQNMEWRSKRKDASGRSNSFAKYATASVFAPLIFTIPFPTFNMADSGQIQIAIQSGGNYIKNILSFFVIFSMFVMLFSGEWRRHVFIIAYTCGYLACLVLSSFAHSGRFHMPIMPMLMLFAAYGIALVQQRKKWKKVFIVVPILEVAICLGWNYFKLKGRGMI